MPEKEDTQLSSQSRYRSKLNSIPLAFLHLWSIFFSNLCDYCSFQIALNSSGTPLILKWNLASPSSSAVRELYRSSHSLSWVLQSLFCSQLLFIWTITHILVSHRTHFPPHLGHHFLLFLHLVSLWVNRWSPRFQSHCTHLSPCRKQILRQGLVYRKQLGEVMATGWGRGEARWGGQAVLWAATPTLNEGREGWVGHLEDGPKSGYCSGT